jgi:hypothetical protein
MMDWYETDKIARKVNSLLLILCSLRRMSVGTAVALGAMALHVRLAYWLAGGDTESKLLPKEVVECEVIAWCFRRGVQ